MESHVVIYGNPVGGFFFVGPFPSREAAAEHISADPLIGAEWWIAPLERPETD